MIKELRNLSKEDIKFLKELQNTMNTQDHCFQASPRFWTIASEKRVYGIDKDYAESCCVIDSEEGDIIADNMKEVYEWLEEYKDELEEYFNKEVEIIYKKLVTQQIDLIVDNELIKTFYELEDVVRFFDCIYNIQMAYYNIETKYEPNFFLTRESCQKHIDRNSYKYGNNPRPYAFTAFRNPLVADLYEIIENVDFDKLNIKEE